jgi:hypothetical protein
MEIKPSDVVRQVMVTIIVATATIIVSTVRGLWQIGNFCVKMAFSAK